MMEQVPEFSDAVFLRENALAYGFREEEGEFRYSRELCGGQFRLEAAVSAAGAFSARLTDTQTEEPYVLHLVEDVRGSFVEQVRGEYRAALREIAGRCFDRRVFHADGTAELLAYALARYGDRPEYLWERFPSNAVLRRKDNRKWYAALLTVGADKLGLARREEVEIADLRMRPEELDAKVDGKKYFRGWHMNKKSWVTVVLDGSVPPAELHRLLDESYRLAQDQPSGRKQHGQRKESEVGRGALGHPRDL